MTPQSSKWYFLLHTETSSIRLIDKGVVYIYIYMWSYLFLSYTNSYTNLQLLFLLLAWIQYSLVHDWKVHCNFYIHAQRCLCVREGVVLTPALSSLNHRNQRKPQYFIQERSTGNEEYEICTQCENIPGASLCKPYNLVATYANE